MLAAARAVVTTSRWTRAGCSSGTGCRGPRARRPTRAPTRRPSSPRTPDGGRLLCVGTLTPLKGQDVLLEALAALAGCPGAAPWWARSTGTAASSPRWRAGPRPPGIADRVRLPGTRTRTALRREYAEADLLVVPSRAETYGMVVTEALAARRAGGRDRRSAASPRRWDAPPTACRACSSPRTTPAALAAALARWLTDDRLRCRLRGAALRRRETLPDWRRTGERVRRVLVAVRAEPDPPQIRVRQERTEAVGVRRRAWAAARLLGGVVILAVLVWRWGRGRSWTACAGSAPARCSPRGRHRRRRPRCAGRGAGASWPPRSGSTCRCPRRPPPTTARSSSTARCPAAWSATSTGGCGTGRRRRPRPRGARRRLGARRGPGGPGGGRARRCCWSSPRRCRPRCPRSPRVGAWPWASCC